MYRIVDLWTARSVRERVLAVGGIVVVFVACCMLLLRGGDPAAVATAAATNVAVDLNSDGTSGTTRVAPGTIRAMPRRPDPAAPAPAGHGVAPLAPSGNGSGAPVATEDAASTAGLNTEMNRSWHDVPKVTTPPPPATSAGVAAAGRALEQVSAAYNDCIKVKPDHYECLGLARRDGIVLERVFDTGAKGLAISIVADHRTVRLIFRGSELCRMLDTASSCQAWVAAR